MAPQIPACVIVIPARTSSHYLTTMMIKRTVALLLAVISCSNAFSTSPSVVVSRREATQQLSMKSDTADDCATGRRSFLTTVAAVIPAIAYSNPAFASGGKLAECAFSTWVTFHQHFFTYILTALLLFSLRLFRCYCW